MILVLSIFIAGIITLVWPIMGLWSLRNKQSGENIFSSRRPAWFGVLCWAYLTLAILGWISFFREPSPLAIWVVGILTLTAGKFLFFYISYQEWQNAFVLLWKNRPAFLLVLGASASVGILMVFTARLLR